MAGPYNYTIGPWVWDTSDPNHPHWRAPVGTIAAVDLRGLPDQAEQGVLGSKPFGFFAVNGSLPVGYDLLGSGDLREINSTALMVSMWNSLLGYSPSGDKLVDLLFDHLTAGSDPTFQNPTPPLMPTTRGVLEILFPEHSPVKRESFRFGVHPHTNKVQAVLHRDYRRMRVEVEAGRMSDGQERRVLDYWLSKYRLNKTDPASWMRLVPPELRAGHPGPLPHSTTITESFNTADSGTLGPDLTWTEIQGDINIVSNRAKIPSAARSRARADSDLSGADHYTQADRYGTDPMVIVRKDSSATLTYYSSELRSDNTFNISKWVSDSNTVLNSGSGTVSAGDTLKLEVNGSSLTEYQNGSSILSTTDTAITGNVRTGIGGYNNDCQFDNFEAADLAAGTPSSLEGSMLAGGLQTLGGGVA